MKTLFYKDYALGSVKPNLPDNEVLAKLPNETFFLNDRQNTRDNYNYTNIDTQEERQTDRQTEKQRERNRDTERDREIDRETEIERERDTLTHTHTQRKREMQRTL